MSTYDALPMLRRSGSKSTPAPDNGQRFELISSTARSFLILLTSSDEILLEPFPRQSGYLLESSGLLEQVRGAGHDLHSFVTTQGTHRFLIHPDYGIVLTADYQQRGSCDVGKSGAGKIRAAAARHDRADAVRLSGSRNKGGAASGACAKVPDRQLMDIRVVMAPFRS